MRLTDIVLKKFPTDRIFRGKHRIVKKVDEKSLKSLHFDYQREERNMLLLRHPYLTVQQTIGYMKPLRPAIRVDWESEKIAKFNRVITLEDRLMHLKVKDAWD